jgi:hypothetical protein
VSSAGSMSNHCSAVAFDFKLSPKFSSFWAFVALVLLRPQHCITFRKSWGLSSGCSSLPQNGLTFSGMKSSLSGGVGVVESWGVDGGVGGGMYEMMGAGLVVRSGSDGNTKESIRDGGLLGSLFKGVGRHLPLESCHMGLASIADVRLATRQSRMHHMRCSDSCMSCSLRSDVI